MLTFFVVTTIVLVVAVGVSITHNMALIAELAPALTVLQQKLNAIFLGVQALKDRAEQAGQIPADAQALLDNLNSNLVALDALVNPPAPGPLP